MARWGMVIDLDRCTGCQGCAVACKVENNIPPNGPDAAASGRSIAWMRLVPMDLEHHGDRPGLQLIPVPCMHCENPPCVKVCPATATTLDEEGLVAQVYARCIGCRYCTTACPYTVRQFNWENVEFPSPLRDGLNPDVSVRPRGVVEKCSFCNHRLQRARDLARFEGRPLEDRDYTPACVDVCPTKAMVFGDLENPDTEVSKLARSKRAFRLLEDLGTEPKVVYLREGSGQ